jgi:hypothetical protein
MSKKSSPFVRNESSYNSLIVEKLKLLGPIKRGSFEIALNIFEIKQIFKESDAYLFLEEGMLETDAGIRDICKGFDLQFLDFSPSFLQKKLIDVVRGDVLENLIQNKKNSISASRLQSYYDCPRKYYVHYLAKLDVRLDSKSGIGSDDKGVLEHLIIGKYFQANAEVKLDALEIDY